MCLQQCFKHSAHTLPNPAVCCCPWPINQPYIIIYWDNNSSFSFRKQYFGTVHFFRVIEHRFWRSFTYWFELRLVCTIFQIWLSVKDSLKKIYFTPDIFLVSHFLWWFCKNWLFTNPVARKETRFFFYLGVKYHTTWTFSLLPQLVALWFGSHSSFLTCPGAQDWGSSFTGAFITTRKLKKLLCSGPSHSFEHHLCSPF